MSKTSITSSFAIACVAAMSALSLCLAPAPASAQPAAGAASGDYVSFNFDQVDIRVFTQLVGQFTGRRFVVADDVDGRITVVSPQVAKDEAFRVFMAVLESSGHTVVEDGDVCRVVRLPDFSGNGIGKIVRDGDAVPESGLITRVIHLEHVSAREVQKLLESQIGRKDVASAVDETNHIIVTDTASAVRRVEEIVKLLDQPGSARITEVVALKHADATKLAHQLSAAVAETQSRADQLLSRIPAASGAPSSVPALRAPLIVAAEHANRLILVGSARQIQSLKELIEKMDVDAPTGRSHLNTIFLKYIKADETAKTITSLLDKTAAKTSDANQIRKISVEANTSNNALIVDAAPQDFASVRELVATLDIAPRQVHISVLIAEVTDTDALQFGVEMTALSQPEGVGDRAGLGATRLSAGATEGIMGTVASGTFGQGISAGITQGAYFDGNGNLVSGLLGFININAIKANSHVKILSEASLGAQNNEEASVGIVDEIPILESTVTGTGSDRDVIQNIKRTDVGVKLRMVPQIIPGGLVRMELEPSIEAVTDSGDASTEFAPTISKRKVSTTVTVPDGKTIVIAGLTRSDKMEVKRKVPILGSIPLIGWLFRWNTTQETDTNILIFVTPQIISDEADSDNVRSEWERKTKLDALIGERDGAAKSDGGQSGEAAEGADDAEDAAE